MGIIKEKVQPLDNKMALMGRDAQAEGIKIVYTEDDATTFIPGRALVSPEVSLKSAYLFAVQIQRVKAYRDGQLDFERWGTDTIYRIQIETMISISAAELVCKYEIPLDEWVEHMQNYIQSFIIKK